MQAGKLRHRITIQRMVDVKGATYKETKQTPTTFKSSVPADYMVLSGRELESASKIVPEARARFEIRYLAGVREKMRVLWGTRYFNIGFVDDIDGRRIKMHLLVTERKSG